MFFEYFSYAGHFSLPDNSVDMCPIKRVFSVLLVASELLYEELWSYQLCKYIEKSLNGRLSRADTPFLNAFIL